MIVTISQNLEYKEWNYVTGVVVKEFLIDLGGLKEFNKEKTFQTPTTATVIVIVRIAAVLWTP